MILTLKFYTTQIMVMSAHKVVNIQFFQQVNYINITHQQISSLMSRNLRILFSHISC